MAEPVMENPFSLPSSRKIQLSKTVQDIQDCVREMAGDVRESGIPINEDSQTLQRFCVKLEYLLQVAQKTKTGVFGGKKDYWNYFCDCLSSNKSLNDGIRFVKSISELRTSLGRGRAFIRFSLMHHRLADSIQQCVSCGKVTSDWYHPKSVWLNHVLSSTLISALYDLNDIQFDLSPGGYDLDAAWPTFARKTFGSSYSWAPPSRSTSISSLASLVTQDSQLPTPLRIPEEADTLQLQNNLCETQSKCDKFEQLFDSSENEKLALEHDMDVLKKRVEQLDKELEDAQMKIKFYTEENAQLSTQLKSKQELWTEKEALLQCRIQNAEKTIREMRDMNKKAIAKKKDEAGKEPPSSTELSLELSTEAEYSTALESELAAVTKELLQKKEVDTKKTQLVALLDRKISQLEQRNSELLAMLGTMTDANDVHTEQFKDTNKGLEELREKLDMNEKRRTMLENSNRELQIMLHSIEDKGQLIARTAKEKLIKYSDENRRLKEQLKVAGGDDSKGDLSDILKKRDSEMNAVKEDLAKLKATLKKIDPDGSQGGEHCMDALETIFMRLVKQSHLIISTLEPTNDTASLLASKLSETEEKLKVVTAELESAQSETTNMTLLVKQSEETVAKLKRDIDNKTAELDLLKTEVQHLRDSKVECEKQIAEEKGCVRTLTTTLREKDAHFFEHMHKISDLQKQVVVLEGTHKLIDNEKETLNQSARDSENEVKILIEEVTNLKSELTAIRTENEALSSEKTSSLKEKEKLTQEIEDLRNKLTEVEDNLTKTSEDQMIHLREQLRLAQEERQTAVAELDQLRMDKDQVSRDCYALVAKTEQDVTKHQQEVKKLRDALTSLEADQSRLTSELESKTRELLDIETKMAHCQNENETLSGDVADMKQMCAKLNAEVDQQRQEKNLMTGALQEKEEALRTLTATSDVMKENQDALQNDKQVLWHECKRLQLDLETATAKCSEQELHIYDLQKATADIASEKEQELQDERQIIADLKQRESDLQKEMKSALDCLAQFMGDSVDGSGSINMATTDLKTQLEVMLNDKQATIDDLREEKCNIDAKLEKQMAECEKKTQCCDELEKAAIELTSEIDGYKTQVKVMQEQLDKVIAELAHVQTDAETKIKDVFEETQSSCSSKISVMSAELESVRAAVVAKETEVREVREMFEQQLSALKFQHSSEQMLHQTTLKDYTAKQDEVSAMMSRIAEQQGQVDMLEVEVHDLRVEQDKKNLQHTSEMEEMTEALEQWKLESQQLKDTVTKRNSELEEKSVLISKLEECLGRREEELSEQRREYEQQTEQLTSDVRQLKEKLVQLLKEKDQLWQKLVQLEYQQQLRSADTWMDSGVVDRCLGCKAEFTFFLRKHHCRMCGRIYCGNCSAHLVMTPHSAKKERVCDVCFMDMSQSEAPAGPDASDASDSDTESTVETPSRQTQSTGDTAADENDTEEGGRRTNSTASDTRLEDPPPDGHNTAPSDPTVAMATAQEDPSPAAGVDAVRVDADEIFDVITQHEVTVSQLEGTTDASTVSGPVVVADQVRGVVESEGDLWVSAGRRYSLPVYIGSPGITLCWEFSTRPKGISFSVTFTGEGGEEGRETEVLIPLCKCNSHKTAVRGELTVRKVGMYTLIFDNVTSRITAKKLEYRLEVQRANDTD